MAAMLTAGLTGLSLATSPAASASDPVIRTGDAVLVNNVFVFGGVIDRVDPATGARTTVTSFVDALNRQEPSQAVSDKAGNIFTVTNSDTDGILWRIDRLTGARKEIARGLDAADLARDKDNTILALSRDFGAGSLVDIDGTSGFTHVIARDGALNGATSLAVESDGSVLITNFDSKKLVRINRSTGTQTTVATFTQPPTGLAIQKDSSILVHLDGGTSAPKIVKVDPVTGAKSTVASGGLLLPRNDGMAMEADGHLLTVEQPDDIFHNSFLVRIDPTTGKQTKVFETTPLEALDLTLAGVDQVPPPPLPIATADFYSAEQPLSDFASPTSVLADDSDQLHQQLTAQLVTQTDQGFVSLASDGSFHYFPPAGFTGTTSFTYRAVAGTRQSTPAQVQITVLPPQSPTARDDFFNAAFGRTTTISAPNVTANDSDPQNDILSARLASNPSHGTARFNADGTLSYTPVSGFSGTDTFTYRAFDGFHLSNPATVEMTVAAGPNTAPKATISAGGTANLSGTAATMKFNVSDAESSADQLTVLGGSSNKTLVPEANIKIGGSGASRTITVTPAAGVTGTGKVFIDVLDPSTLR